MVKAIKRIIVFFVLSVLLIQNFAYAFPQDALNEVTDNMAEYIYKTVENPKVGSVGGEWAVFGLARSDFGVPEKYYTRYYENVEEYVRSCNGKLHDRKYTEYARVVIALTSIGNNPSDVAGYNLLMPLGDYDKIVWQGLNGPVWALMALDSGGYEMPINNAAATQATRDMYIDRILSCQLSDGGFALSTGDVSDGSSWEPDITGMTLQALARYKDRDDVKKSIDRALLCISENQGEDGGYVSHGVCNSENISQIIIALNELDISIDDPRFVKNGNTLTDNLMEYYIPNEGFMHTKETSTADQMATEQAFYALVSLKRYCEGKNKLYHMEDAIKISVPDKSDLSGVGLSGKNEAVRAAAVKEEGKTFADISEHKNKPAIEALAERGIISGKTETEFEPDNTITRAELAAVLVRGMGLETKSEKIFNDVSESDWYFDFVSAAYSYGIIMGTDMSTFNPNGTVTREAAACMVARAAKLCGMDTEVQAARIRDILAGFTDYVKASDWARPSLAFCYSENILSDKDIEILPKSEASRGEVAQMLYNMLNRAELL